jgi:ankyrin repeat protein
MGHGLLESEESTDGTPRPRLFHELVRAIDAIARKMEREERLLAMNGGDLDETLREAARAGGVKDVRFLMASGADATADDGEVLWRARDNGHLAVAEALLESGAAFTQGCLNGSLWDAAYGGHTACCELLLDHGADVHYAGDIPLCMAAMNGHLQTAALLLDRGANAWSERAMEEATENAHEPIVELLLERRAA